MCDGLEIILNCVIPTAGNFSFGQSFQNCGIQCSLMGLSHVILPALLLLFKFRKLQFSGINTFARKKNVFGTLYVFNIRHSQMPPVIFLHTSRFTLSGLSSHIKSHIALSYIIIQVHAIH